MVETSGLAIGLVEIVFFVTVATGIKRWVPAYRQIDLLTYYWLAFTILTGLWECAYIIGYAEVRQGAIALVDTGHHVWTSDYPIDYLLPWKLASIFYGEYGAYADRLYMAKSGVWSRIIEGTHATYCAIFSCGFFWSVRKSWQRRATVFKSVAMGCQLMNSILYMGQYFIQMSEKGSANYPTPSFPAGIALIRRPFMYVNVFWTFLPALIIILDIRKFRLKS